MRRIFALALVLLCALPALAGAPRSFGYAMLTVPDGWTAQEQDGALALYPTVSQDALILVMVNMGAVSDLNAFLTQVMTTTQSGETVVEQAGVQPLQMQQVQALVGGATTRGADGGQISRLYAVANPGGAGTLVLYGADNAQAFEAKIGAFQSVLESLTFSNLAVAAPSPAPGPAPAPTTSVQSGDGGLSGLWAGTEQRMWFNPATSQMQFSWIDHYFYFSPDGLFLKGAPLDWSNPDWRSECAKREAYACGRYSHAGEKLILRGNDGETDERFFQREGANFNGGGYLLFPMKATPAGYVLDGKYSATTTFPIGYMGSQIGLASVGTEYVFSRDGRFTTASGGGGVVVGGPGGSSSFTQAAGRYRVNGTSITLAFDSGTTETVSFFLWTDDAAYIDVGGRKLSRQ